MFFLVSAICGVAGLFVLGDYFSLFGLKKYLLLDFIDASFRIEEQATGVPVGGVRIKCFQQGNENACTQKDGRSRGLVIARVPIQKIVWESLLFRNKEDLVPPRDPQLHIMFIHYDYDNPVESFAVAEIYREPPTEYLVKMERRFKAE